jgi:hypothetical protein
LLTSRPPPWEAGGVLGSLDRLLAALFEPMNIQSPEHISRDDRRIDERFVCNEPVGVERVDENNKVVGLVAQIKDCSEGGVSILVNTPLAVGETLWLKRESEPLVKAVVRHVKEQEDGYLLGLVLVKVERRRTNRDRVAGRGTLAWATSRGESRHCAAAVTNANEFGVRIEIPVEIPVGSVATLEGDVMQCTGPVCYCNALDDGTYSIGLHIAGKPRNLTNPGVPGTEFV